MNTVRLSPELESQVRRTARRQNLTVSEVHRRALAEYCARALSSEPPGRFDDIIGVCTGDPDLGANVGAIFAAEIGRREARIEGDDDAR